MSVNVAHDLSVKTPDNATDTPSLDGVKKEVVHYLDRKRGRRAGETMTIPKEVIEGLCR